MYKVEMYFRVRRACFVEGMSMPSQTLAQGAEAAGQWEQTIYAFLAEKERRSGSMRTVDNYSRMLYRFFGVTGKPPDKVVVGVQPSGQDVTVEGWHLLQDRALIGAFHGSARARVDFLWLLDLYNQGKLKLDELNEAFDDMTAGTVARTGSGFRLSGGY